MNELCEIRELLLADKMKYSSHLKMMEEYGDSMDCRLLRREGFWEAALLIPVSCSSFDMELYPDAKYIVYLAASGEITPEMLRCIPKDADLVFKTHDDICGRAVQSMFPAELRRALLSYTSPAGARFAECPEVARGDVLDEELLPLWRKNGYCREDIEKYFANGARSFSIHIGGKPASTCLIFHNCLDIWEVGAVHTAESERGKGLARKAVSAALNAILSAGNVPKYQAASANLPSIRLAGSLGLQLFLTLEHRYYKAK
jgi:RimJ/RimL family protein N-acetyltransferase